MQVVSVNAAGDGAGNSGGVSGGDLRAGIAEGDVEVPQGGQRGENGPVRRHKLSRETARRGYEPFRGRHEGKGWMEAFGGENG